MEDILELTGYQVEEGGDFALKVSENKQPKFSKSALRRLYYPKYSKETIHSLSIVDETVINYELLASLLEYISLNQAEGVSVHEQNVRRNIRLSFVPPHFSQSSKRSGHIGFCSRLSRDTKDNRRNVQERVFPVIESGHLPPS